MVKSLMVQGTASDAGKSIIAAGLCRIFKQDGLEVVPFKSQNMALNSFITKKGDEMGRAQVVQAEAAGKEPDVRMNPVLLKPTSDRKSQVVFLGRVLRDIRLRKSVRSWVLKMISSSSRVLAVQLKSISMTETLSIWVWPSWSMRQ